MRGQSCSQREDVRDRHGDASAGLKVIYLLRLARQRASRTSSLTVITILNQ